MSMYISLNGKLSPVDAPILSAQNRGLKYGDSLFETVKCVNGEPLFLEAHLKRLYHGMDIMEFEWTDHLLKSVLYEEIQRLLQRNRLMQGARVRLTVFRADGGKYTPVSNKVNILIETEEDQLGYQLNKDGLLLGVFEEYQKPVHPLMQMKSANAALFVKAALTKKKMELDDLIILNDRGLICETISSNIFLVIHDRLITPPLSEGCLPGVMRENVLKVAHSLGMEVLETPIGVNALEQAEEVFTSNAIQGTQWIKGFGPKRYFHRVSERINQALNDAISQA